MLKKRTCRFFPAMVSCCFATVWESTAIGVGTAKPFFVVSRFLLILSCSHDKTLSVISWHESERKCDPWWNIPTNSQKHNHCEWQKLLDLPIVAIVLFQLYTLKMFTKNALKVMKHCGSSSKTSSSVFVLGVILLCTSRPGVPFRFYLHFPFLAPTLSPSVSSFNPTLSRQFAHLSHSNSSFSSLSSFSMTAVVIETFWKRKDFVQFLSSTRLTLFGFNDRCSCSMNRKSRGIRCTTRASDPW